MPASYLGEDNSQYLIKVGDEFSDEEEIEIFCSPQPGLTVWAIFI